MALGGMDQTCYIASGPSTSHLVCIPLSLLILLSLPLPLPCSVFRVPCTSASVDPPIS